MSLHDLAGSAYGPFPFRVSPERVAAYVAATGDDPTRWVQHAPPTFAGALLFVAAPAFLEAEAVAPFTSRLVHLDQSFAWHRALRVGEEVAVDGALSRVRERGDTSFVTFDATVRAGTEAVIEASSTFLMGEGSPEQGPVDEAEPSVRLRGPCDPLPDRLSPRPGTAATVARSASRLDLVRYAAASGDFNPIHFDHDTARRAGFPGVLVHGLLMGAWLIQLAAAYSPRPDGVATARLRFRSPLRPGVAARVAGEVDLPEAGTVGMRLGVSHDATTCVDAKILVRTA